MEDFLMKKKLGLVYGGKSAEHEVSLSTALAVLGAIDFTKYEVTPIFITKQGEWRCGAVVDEPLATIEALRLPGENRPHNIMSFLVDEQQNLRQFDVIFPLLHGTNGEDGTVQGLFEVLNLPYVGNTVLGSSTGMDKVVMKQLFEMAGLPQLPYIHFIQAEWQENQEVILQQCEDNLTYPMYVKPANLGSSVGISKAQTREELSQAIEFALKYDRKIVVEQGVIAREIELAVLGNDHPSVSVAGEIKSVSDFYDYESKYADGSTELIIPAKLANHTYLSLQTMAKKAFKAIDGSGLVRADFFVTADETIYINEVNTLPGFTPVSMYPLLWQKTDVAYTDLIDRLIALAFERHEQKQKLQFDL